MKAFITLALFYLLATSAFAASNIKLYGDLEFYDGTKQTTAIVQGPVGIQGAQGETGPAGPQGAPGTNSLNSLILLVAEVSGANCTNGGVKIQTGLDLNRDGALGAGEVTQTKYICNGSATSSAAGSVTGTVTYTGSMGIVSASNPILVFMNPYPNSFDSSVANGTTTQGATLSASPSTFTFTNVPAGQYHLGAVFARFNGAISVGDPSKIYTPGNNVGSNYHADPATAFTVTAGQLYSTFPNISFDDSMWVGQ